MRANVKHFVQQCLISQRDKHSHLHTSKLLQPLPIPHQVWEELAMDFIVGLPPFNGFTIIMVVINQLSKCVHFATLKFNFTGAQVAEKFVNMVVKLHGIPSSIVSDRDKIFTSNFWQHMSKLQGGTCI